MKTVTALETPYFSRVCRVFARVIHGLFPSPTGTVDKKKCASASRYSARTNERRGSRQRAMRSCPKGVNIVPLATDPGHGNDQRAMGLFPAPGPPGEGARARTRRGFSPRGKPGSTLNGIVTRGSRHAPKRAAVCDRRAPGGRGRTGFEAEGVHPWECVAARCSRVNQSNNQNRSNTPNTPICGSWVTARNRPLMPSRT